MSAQHEVCLGCNAPLVGSDEINKGYCGHCLDSGRTPEQWCWINANQSDQRGDFVRAGRLFGDGDLVAEVSDGGFIYTTKERAALIAAAPATAAERDRLKADKARLLEALKPLADHADITEQFFTTEELDAMDQDHHLVAHGITVADCFRARQAIAEAKKP